MKKWTLILFASVLTCGLVYAGLGPPAPDSFWIDGELYRTIGTPTELPDRGPKDGIYVFEGLSGQTPVAEAGPGDRDYNGGRWQVEVLEFTAAGIDAHDPDGDGQVNFELMSWEEVEDHIDLGHLMKKMDGPSFVCPAIKQK